MLQKCAAPLAKPSPSEIKSASHSFDVITAETIDGFYFKHFSMLSDEDLNLVGSFFMMYELIEYFPSQFRFLMIPLLPKPQGGLRSVMLFANLFRLWTKVRLSAT